MSAATMNEMDRLRRERDEARAGRDALEAHVERLRGYLVGYSQLLREKAATFEGDSEAAITLRSNHYREAHAVDTAYKAAPATSLARLIAEKQAEALHSLLMHPRTDGAAMRKRAVEMRDELRRRAEESTNGHN